jgi:hypothetical protein
MTTCRGCESSRLSPVVSLGRIPPVNAFLEPAQIAAEVDPRAAWCS